MISQTMKEDGERSENYLGIFERIQEYEYG